MPKTFHAIEFTLSQIEIHTSVSMLCVDDEGEVGFEDVDATGLKTIVRAAITGSDEFVHLWLRYNKPDSSGRFCSLLSCASKKAMKM